MFLGTTGSGTLFLVDCEYGARPGGVKSDPTAKGFQDPPAPPARTHAQTLKSQHPEL